MSTESNHQTWFDHEKLDVYQLELEFLTWVSPLLREVRNAAEGYHREVCDQLDRASLSALLNTAEGNGKRQGRQRAKFFDDARGSGVECAACLDALVAKRLATTERVMGGKTVLLAGATDERIAVTGPNDSGSGGAGSFVWQGPESENMGHGKEMIPYWYGPDLWQYIGKETEMPFDQHFLKALVAPRALVSTEALGDVWANPSGTLKTHLAAKEVFKFLGTCPFSRSATMVASGWIVCGTCRPGVC